MLLPTTPPPATTIFENASMPISSFSCLSPPFVACYLLLRLFFFKKSPRVAHTRKDLKNMTRVGNVAKSCKKCFARTHYLLPVLLSTTAMCSSRQSQQVQQVQQASSASTKQPSCSTVQAPGTGSRLCLPFMTQLFIQFNQAVSSILLHSIRPGLPLTSSFVHSPAYGRESFGLGRVFRWRVRVRTLNDTKSTRGGLCRQVSSSVVGVVG